MPPPTPQPATCCSSGVLCSQGPAWQSHSTYRMLARFIVLLRGGHTLLVSSFNSRAIRLIPLSRKGAYGLRPEPSYLPR